MFELNLMGEGYYRGYKYRYVNGSMATCSDNGTVGDRAGYLNPNADLWVMARDFERLMNWNDDNRAIHEQTEMRLKNALAANAALRKFIVDNGLKDPTVTTLPDYPPVSYGDNL